MGKGKSFDFELVSTSRHFSASFTNNDLLRRRNKLGELSRRRMRDNLEALAEGLDVVQYYDQTTRDRLK